MYGYDESDVAKTILAFALESELQSLQRNSLNTAAFIKEGCIEAFQSQDLYSFYKQKGSVYLVNTEGTDSEYDYMHDTYVYGGVIEHNKVAITWLDGEKSELTGNEVVISKCVFKALIEVDNTYDFTNTTQIKQDLQNANIQRVIYDYLNGEREFHDINVVGICEDIPTEDEYSYIPPYIIISHQLYEEINLQPIDAYYDFIVGPMPSSRATIKQLVQDSYQNVDHYRLTNIVCEEIEYIDDILEVLSKVFLWIGVFFAIFACLMLANFINNSIHYKKQEIGILRAIGARSIDVFKIFYAESFIIAAINYVVSIIAIIITVICINYSFRSNMNLMISVLRFGIRQIIIVLLITMFTAFIATFIPIFRIAKKKPIDAIRNR
ncbi:MAG: FtsX-like permease family protein [Bacilli bacterium]|nr:FtsX-like permease family protein [Bacilli bacterium]